MAAELAEEERLKAELEEYFAEDDEYGVERDDEEKLPENDGKKGIVGIKKTDLELEEKRDLISVIKFRITDIFNPRKPNDQIRKFELYKGEQTGGDVVAKLQILKCAFLDRFTFLDYIQSGCELSTIIGMDFTLSNKSQKDPRSLHHLHKELSFYYQQ